MLISNTQESNNAAWSSKTGFMLASIGFAVGLGNIWRFPYVTGENGGGAFVIVYLLCALCIGVPILIAELVIGRKGKLSPPGSMQTVALSEGCNPSWQWVGRMNLLAAFLIMVVYCVISGWVLNYLYKSLFDGFAQTTEESALAEFNGLLNSPYEMLFWTTVALLTTGLIIYAGVQNGIERAVKILMPSMLLFLAFLVVYNFFIGGFVEALEYLFTPDFSKIDASVILAAIGQAFFSVGVAMAGMMTYGAYLPKNLSIPGSALTIVLIDSLVAIMAGLAIFPAVFHNGLDPAGGPGLIFQTLPVAFSSMSMGYLVAVLFFLLMSFAAISSMVGLVEPQTKWLEEHKGFERHNSAVVIISTIGVLSIFSILGYNVLADFKIMSLDINSSVDFLSNQILLPLGGLLIALFAGWFITHKTLVNELDIGSGLKFKLWLYLIRYVVPIAVALVLLMGLRE